MSKVITKNNTVFFILATLLLVPVFAFATEYQPLAGSIPGLSNTDDLGSYVNALFNLAMMFGVIISVIIISYSGFEYMTIDAVTKKGMAKKRIRQAVTGLLMLLATYLVFNQINPDILKLEVFN